MRISYSEDEQYPGQFELWQANCRRSLRGKAGQAALHELEQALLALPNERLLANRLVDSDGDVCALGALAQFKGHALYLAEGCGLDDDFDFDDDGMEDFGVELGMPRLVAWKVVEENDIQLGGPLSPEDRYRRMLAWVQAQLVT